MSVIHFNGFENINTLSNDYASQSGATIISTSTPRTGNYHLQLNNTNSFVRFDLGADAHATVTVGYGRKTTGFTTSDHLRFYGDAASTIHITTQLLSSGVFNVYRGTNAGTLLGSVDLLSVYGDGSVWHYFETKVVLDDTAGEVTVKLDGITVLSITGVDTKNGGTLPVFSSVSWFLTQATNAYHDDMYVTNGVGSAPVNGFLGDCRVERLLPNANGNSSQLIGSDGNSTDNYLLVDEPTPSSADYVGDVTVGDKDTYGMSDLASTNVTVYGVRVGTYAAKSDAGAKSGRAVLRTASTDYTTADFILSTSYQHYLNYWMLNPNTGVAWTPAEINALELGFEVRT